MRILIMVLNVEKWEEKKKVDSRGEIVQNNEAE